MAEESTILLVDDDPGALETLGALLSTENYNLVFSGGGTEALELIDDVNPDVILMDVMMPDITGFEVCRIIRNTPEIAEIPIILVTALDDRDSRIEGIKSGADEFVTKPYDKLELRARIKTIVRLNRYRNLLRERKKFDFVADRSESGFLIVDDNQSILYTNQTARRYLGIEEDSGVEELESLSKLIGKNYRLVPEESWEDFPKNTASETEPENRYLVSRTTADKEGFWLQMHVMEADRFPSDQHLIQLKDVTENIRQQHINWTLRRQVEHKLRNRINSLMGFMEILQTNYDTLPDEKRKVYLDAVQKSVGRMFKDFNHFFKLLDWGQDEEQGKSTTIQDFVTIAKKTASDFSLKYFRIEVHEKVDSTRSIAIRKNALQEIFEEIIGNSEKFHPEKKPEVVIGLFPDETGVIVRMKDDGIHLPPGEISKIWKPFYQSEIFFTGEIPGMGMGLHMVATLVWQAGGTCSLFNRKDKTGLVFEMVLPFSEV